MNSLIRKQLLACTALLCVHAFLQTSLIYANSLPLDEERLPPFSKNTNLFANLANGTKVSKNESQNLFQSSISCGHSEFYVQINFNKPFNGLVYAYKYPQIDDHLAKYYYPVQILETCMLQGNGASVVYLELSFLSECVEKLSSYSDSQVIDEPADQPNRTSNESQPQYPQTPASPSDSNTGVNSSTVKVNLDGFNFRRALNDNAHYLNISSDETYQLSLYIQNDRQIEQKTDSKVTILCSSRVTKNIIFEQNVSSDYSRKVDAGQQAAAVLSGHRNRTIVPSAQLNVQPYLQNDNNQTVSSAEIIDSRIDILRGSIPFLKIIDNSVELGDDLTLIIRSKEMDGFDSKIANCYSHNGTHGQRHDLTNDDGCTLNGSIMPNFQVMLNTGSESKVYYTTFAAFKFPNANQLSIQCTLTVCNKPCPKVSCENRQQ